jgi:hypothetical protein
MALLLIIPAWLLLASAVIVLCRAAQLGDREQQQPSPYVSQASPNADRITPASNSLSSQARVNPRGLVRSSRVRRARRVGERQTGAPSAREPSGEAVGAANRVRV